MLWKLLARYLGVPGNTFTTSDEGKCDNVEQINEMNKYSILYRQNGDHTSINITGIYNRKLHYYIKSSLAKKALFCTKENFKMLNEFLFIYWQDPMYFGIWSKGTNQEEYKKK